MTANDSSEPTGERFIPELMGGELIEAEHQARYRLVLPFVRGKRVLDAGCGTGWGTKLLAAAGAQSVVGVDISAEAIEDSRRRTPEASFVEGDLQALPFEDGSFDVVVCFEALEHTHDVDLTLDHLVRVLAADGVLFVSSPNPAVYPAGNPFHFNELPPDVLNKAVSARLTNVALYRQHLHLASTLHPDGGTDQPFRLETFPVRPIAPGHDPYSVAVASNGPLPELSPVQAISPADQLDNLGALASTLTEERDSIAHERATFAQLHTDLNSRLIEAGKGLEHLTAERDSAIDQLQHAVDELARTAGQRDAAIAQQVASAADVAGLNALTARLGAERDRFAVELVRVEQELARLRPARTGDGEDVDPAVLRERIERLIERNAQLERDLLTVRATLSWRITRPLRALRTLTNRHLH